MKGTYIHICNVQIKTQLLMNDRRGFLKGFIRDRVKNIPFH